MSRQRVSLVLLAAALCIGSSAAAQSNDPPGRVGRVSDVNGAVSLLLAGDTEWRNASLNYPLTTGDALWADAGARTEIHLGASAVHLAEGTSLALDAIEDNLVQLRIGQGAVHIRLRELFQDDSYEIDTPAGPILLRAAGDYRVDVTPDGQRTTVTVRDGAADVLVGNDSYPVRPGTSVTLTGSASRPMAVERAMAPDDWEQWADARSRREDAATATRYVPREMVGYEDLDPYGDWQVDAQYGPIWYPRSVAADWAPYRTGRWESVQPWGWTWIDDAPWGFAPFHYGRWSHDRGRWGWIPGGMRERPVYAPALVAFVSGSGWGASLSIGGNGGVGWIPLGPEEVYVPAYRASPAYARNINITNVNITRIDVTRVDVNAVQYRNRNVQGAVTVVRRDDFMGSRPVGRAAVRLRPEDFASTRVSAVPIAADAPVAPPRRGSPMDRPRADNAGPVRQPPVELPRSPNPPSGGRGRAFQDRQITPPPAVPAPQPNQGQDRPKSDRQPPVTPPPAVPTKPAIQNQGRGLGYRQLPVPQPPVTRTPPPAQNPGRADQRPPVTSLPAVPAQPPTQGQGQGRGRAQQAQPQPPAARLPTPIPAVPTTPPVRGGGHATPVTPTAPTPVIPPVRAPVTPPPSGRGTPASPTTPAPVRGRTTPPDAGRSGKPPKTRPDTIRNSGGPSSHLDYRV